MTKGFYVHVFLLALLLIPTLGESRELVFSTHPFTNPTAIHKRFEPLVAYLSKKTGAAITIRIAPSYLANIRALAEGEADLGFAGPSPYVRMKDKYGAVDLLARFKIADDLNDRVVIIARQDSWVKTLEDLVGRSFAFGDHQSFGSHFMPRWILHKKGVRLSDLTAYDFVRSHDNVVLSVLHGDFDGGGVRQDVFMKYDSRPLKILAGPFSIPPHVIVCRKNLDGALKDSLRKALLTLDTPRVLSNIDPKLIGFSPVSDADFDEARKIMQFLESR